MRANLKFSLSQSFLIVGSIVCVCMYGGMAISLCMYVCMYLYQCRPVRIGLDASDRVIGAGLVAAELVRRAAELRRKVTFNDD